MRNFFLLLIFTALFCIPANTQNIYVVNTKEKADFLMNKAIKYSNGLRLKVKGPINFNFVTPQELDFAWEGPLYIGVEAGLYKHKDGAHNIYVQRDLDSDSFYGLCVHEYVHAWQKENCLKYQDEILHEGFARLVEIKALTDDGAYLLADKYRKSDDRRYTDGFWLLLRYEDKFGWQSLINLVKTVKYYYDVKIPV